MPTQQITGNPLGSPTSENAITRPVRGCLILWVKRGEARKDSTSSSIAIRAASEGSSDIDPVVIDFFKPLGTRRCLSALRIGGASAGFMRDGEIVDVTDSRRLGSGVLVGSDWIALNWSFNIVSSLTM